MEQHWRACRYRFAKTGSLIGGDSGEIGREASCRPSEHPHAARRSVLLLPCLRWWVRNATASRTCP